MPIDLASPFEARLRRAPQGDEDKAVILRCEARQRRASKDAGFVLAVILVLIVFTSPAAACRWEHETVSFLNRLPETAMQEEIVARVEVVKTLVPFEGAFDYWFTHLLLVRVIEPLKGIALGEEIVLNTRGTFCDQNATGKMAGQRGFIAGRMQWQENGDLHFTGRWRRDLASGGLVKDAD